MKNILQSLLKSMILYGFFFVAGSMVVVKSSRLSLVDFLMRFGKSYSLVWGISLGLYILAFSIIQYRINYLHWHPPLDLSKSAAEKIQEKADYWMRWIVGPVLLFSIISLIGFLFYAAGHPMESRFAVPITLFFLFVLLLTSGANVLLQDYLHFLRKRLAKTVDEVLSEGRAPVLYLRSFLDDAVSAKRETALLTEEEQVNKAFNEIGPMIAIGKPGEVLPEVGAARAYFSNADWQGAVWHYMEISRLVVLRAGLSQGLLWEIRNSVQRLPPLKLILLIPFEKDAYNQFRESVQAIFPKCLPDHPGHSVHRETTNANGHTEKQKFGSLLGLIHFDDDWSAHFEKVCADAVPQDYEMIGNPLVVEKTYLMLHHALRPVYNRLGMEWDDLGLAWKS